MNSTVIYVDCNVNNVTFYSEAESEVIARSGSFDKNRNNVRTEKHTGQKMLNSLRTNEYQEQNHMF